MGEHANRNKSQYVNWNIDVGIKTSVRQYYQYRWFVVLYYIVLVPPPDGRLNILGIKISTSA